MCVACGLTPCRQVEVAILGAKGDRAVVEVAPEPAASTGSALVAEALEAEAQNLTSTDPAVVGGSRALVRAGSSGAIVPTAGLEPGLDARLRGVFDRVDKDSDGAINRRELIIALRKHQDICDLLNLPGRVRKEDGSRDRVEAFIQTLDADGDNTLTSEELLRHFALNLVSGPVGTEALALDDDASGSGHAKELTRLQQENVRLQQRVDVATAAEMSPEQREKRAFSVPGSGYGQRRRAEEKLVQENKLLKGKLEDQAAARRAQHEKKKQKRAKELKRVKEAKEAGQRPKGHRRNPDGVLRRQDLLHEAPDTQRAGALLRPVRVLTTRTILQKMALITSNCGATRYLCSKWP